VRPWNVPSVIKSSNPAPARMGLGNLGVIGFSSMRQTHQVRSLTERAQFIQLLVWLQILIARGSSPESLWQAIESAIEKLNSGH
jgi:hypothetical protein